MERWWEQTLSPSVLGGKIQHYHGAHFDLITAPPILEINRLRGEDEYVHMVASARWQANNIKSLYSSARKPEELEVFSYSGASRNKLDGIAFNGVREKDENLISFMQDRIAVQQVTSRCSRAEFVIW